MKKSNKNRVQENMKAIQTMLEGLEKKRFRQKQAYESGLTSLEEYTEDTTNYEQKKIELREELKVKFQELRQETKIEERSRKSLLALANFKKIWGKADFSSKKELLSALLDKVIVKSDEIEVVFAHS